MFRKLIFLILGLSALLSIMGVGPTTTVIAVNIATAVVAIALPFLPLAHLNLSGPKMVAVSMVAAFVVAVGASLITGDLKLADLSGSFLPLLEKFTIIWTAQQAVFQLFKDSMPALTTKPIGTK